MVDDIGCVNLTELLSVITELQTAAEIRRKRTWTVSRLRTVLRICVPLAGGDGEGFERLRRGERDEIRDRGRERFCLSPLCLRQCLTRGRKTTPRL